MDGTAVDSLQYRRMTLPHPTETRPWGAFQNLFEAQGYLVKLIEVTPGHRLSLQRHALREEFWVIVRGEGVFELDDERRDVREGDMVRVGLRQVHRVRNSGGDPLLILELQKGECREDDIERLEDDYKRA